MSPQHDYVIDNSTGANVRSDINSVLQAIASNNSGTSDPSTTVASQFFADTNAGIMKLRNTSNNGFVNLFTLAGGVDVDAASNFNEDVTFQGANHTIVFDKSEDALKFADNAIAKFGGSSDLQIFNNGSTTSFIQETQANLFLSIAGGSNQLQLNKGTSENMAVFVGDGQVILYHDNSERLETTASGVNFGGNLTSSSNTTFTISAGGTGTAGHVSLKCGSEDAFLARPNGAVELFYNNTKMLETNIPSGHNGEVILGQKVKIRHTGSGNGQIFPVSGNMFLNAKEGETSLLAVADGQVELYHDNSKKLETTNSGIAVSGKIGVGGSASNQSINTISVEGNAQTTLFYGFGTIDLTSASDERVKNNVVDTAKGLDDILKLRIVDFTYTPEYAEDSTTVRTGGIAQEWQKVDSNLVNAENENLLFIEYKRVIPHLIKAVQELSAKVAALEAA